MTTKIEREGWKPFFDELSRDLAGWQTVVEIFSDNVGAQVLAEGLPFGGLTFEDGSGKPSIELALGEEPEYHQTHSIVDPQVVAFEGTGVGPAGVLDIEDGGGMTTLIKFVQPFPVLAEYVETEIVRVATNDDRSDVH
jgi:hypothetical protein